MTSIKHLKQAEAKAEHLFQEAVRNNIIQAGSTEKDINEAIFKLARELYGIEKYWHKRIVRAGKNTLHPYDENPENLTVQDDDIVFLDFGPIIEEWEADYGRTYVIGNDPLKKKLAADSENLWFLAQEYLLQDPSITGAQLYDYCMKLAQKHGWEYGGPIAGHLIGHFPHEQLEKELKTNYIHPENHVPMNELNQSGEKRHWIIEIHIVDKKNEIGAFFEQVAM